MKKNSHFLSFILIIFVFLLTGVLFLHSPNNVQAKKCSTDDECTDVSYCLGRDQITKNKGYCKSGLCSYSFNTKPESLGCMKNDINCSQEVYYQCGGCGGEKDHLYLVRKDANNFCKLKCEDMGYNKKCIVRGIPKITPSSKPTIIPTIKPSPTPEIIKTPVPKLTPKPTPVSDGRVGIPENIARDKANCGKEYYECENGIRYHFYKGSWNEKKLLCDRKKIKLGTCGQVNSAKERCVFWDGKSCREGNCLNSAKRCEFNFNCGFIKEISSNKKIICPDYDTKL